mgnify:CR=1 FL=1
MNVIFKNIPTGIKKYELAKMIESTFNVGHISRESLYIPIGDINIWQTEYGDQCSVEQFGVVRICPLAIAKKVIEKLNGCRFNIIAREFFSRSQKNDPRLKNLDTLDTFKEQRTGDRRAGEPVKLRQL